MAAKSVTVSYNPSTNGLTYAPNNGNVDVTEAGTITFSKPGQQGFRYTGFQAVAAFTPPPANNDFSWVLDPNGNLVVTDNDADKGTYNYTISFSVSGQDGKSDPQIINKS
jgi:hypothetical protein